MYSGLHVVMVLHLKINTSGYFSPWQGRNTFLLGRKPTLLTRYCKNGAAPSGHKIWELATPLPHHSYGSNMKR